MSRQSYMDNAFPSKACIQRAIDSMFKPNPDFHKMIKELRRRREVRKKMAIDYGEEWRKFRVYYGRRQVETKGVNVSIGELMDGWIKNVIDGREKLMEEYVKAQMGTEIIGADRGYHTVGLEFFGESRGTIPISKNAFNTWIRNRKKGGKVNAEH